MTDNDAAPEIPVRLREVLGQMPDYKPGKPAAAPPGVTAYKLSSNENPYGPLPSVLRAVQDAAADINRYPDMAVTGLRERLAKHLGVEADDIATGTGSVAVLAQIINATCEPGDQVIFAWRSFEAYPIVTQLAGASPIMVALDDQQRHRLDAMYAAITDRTRVILICTPNNPTGPVVTSRQLKLFLDRCPKDILVVLDEAYLEFVRDEEAPDGLEFWRNYSNVALLRTFSKAYGLAGLRVGYAVAHPEVAAAIRKTATPFGVNSLAQVAAIASLDAYDELNQRVEALVEERARVSAALEEQGWKLPESQANFVYFPLGEDCTAFTEACEKAGLMVRQYGDDGVRVTIGEPEANSRLIEVAKEFGPR